MGAEDPAFLLAIADREQHFLIAPERLAMLVEAAGITPTDDVVEVGAGIGTVAAVIPECASLTLVELDGRLAAVLAARLPRAHVIQGDALLVLPQLEFDVLLSNLPRAVTVQLLKRLGHLRFRSAVLAVAEDTNLDVLRVDFHVTVVTILEEDDYRPRQPVKSNLIRVGRRTESDRG